MASRVAILRSIVGNTACSTSGSRRWVHNTAATAITPSLNNYLHHPSLPPSLLFPWSLPNPDRDGEWSKHVGVDGDLGGLGFPGFPVGEAMELAVPKKKEDVIVNVARMKILDGDGVLSRLVELIRVLGFGVSVESLGGFKVSPHKRGIRNGPKALKPTPVIIRCRVCGRVKLPHFYCCSGHKENASEKNG